MNTNRTNFPKRISKGFVSLTTYQKWVVILLGCLVLSQIPAAVNQTVGTFSGIKCRHTFVHGRIPLRQRQLSQ
ncbi:hypothetical protein PMIT1313_00445 [Prochlorococcus marinus str. MIT 1313]|nr:hypothetical protein PMIT1313_00445 [Prochlorococcus marinus str. MIT 1313]KZR73003.1 hypothetical protein PMIT1318_00589 [Prochlorococcus marinus str. MIT 1318]